MTDTQHQQSILIVEDDPSILKLFEVLLTYEGYLVTGCRTGKEAVKILSAAQNSFDLIVLDYYLPDVTGGDIADYIKAHLLHKNTPVLLVSAEQATHRFTELLSSGKVSLYLPKPPDTRKMMNYVKMMIQTNRK